jgi:Fe-S-cluster-containing hydrogenase component 2/CRP-like cAMP-binding protein
MGPDPKATGSFASMSMALSMSRFASAREEESLFARDDEDVLVRKERETRDRFKVMVTVSIDGYEVTVPKAVPRTDPQGNFIREPDGGLAPRTTTIYDAAAQVFSPEELARRIPVLCHQPHQNPVALCRMCSVQISNPKKGRPERKLLPACQHPVEDGMQITTRRGGDGYNPAKKLPTASQRDRDAAQEAAEFAAAVDHSVGILAELLLADHRQPPLSAVMTPEGTERDGRFKNELELVAEAIGVVGPRRLLPRNPGGDSGRNAQHAGPRETPFPARYARARRVELPVLAPLPDPEALPDSGARRAWESWNEMIDEKFPYSSRTVVVDHDRCILCDRCVRACSEDKPFKIIGHTGKGYNTRISFDLDRLMGESNCVQCGQCMTYCPTGALSLRRRVQPRAWGDESPRQIPQHPATPFPPAPDIEGQGAARFLTADEMLEVELEYKDPDTGKLGRFQPFANIPYTFLKWNEGAVRERSIAKGETAVLCEVGHYDSTAFLLKSGMYHIRGTDGSDAPAKSRWRGNGRQRLGPPVERPHTVMILGEMACMTAQPRNRTIEAIGPAKWYEVTRNVLDMIQRTPSARRLLDRIYTPRSIRTCFEESSLFQEQLSRDEREKAISFLASVNNPEDWVKGLQMPDIGRLWRELFREDRIAPDAPVTTLGFEHRETLAKLTESKPQELGFLPDEGRKLADGIRNGRIATFILGLSRAASARVVREFVGDATFARWFPDTPADDPRPRRLLKFLLLPPAPGQPHAWPPPGLERQALEFLLRFNPVQLRRVDAGQPIVGQNETANDFYMIRLGFVRVQIESGGITFPVNHLGPKDVFGEVALLSQHPALVGPGGVPPKRSQKRLASVVALDPTEVVRVRGPVFYLLCAAVPKVEQLLLAGVKKLREQNEHRKNPASPTGAWLQAEDAKRPEFLQLGLYQGQKLLVLDLLSCTRCDECTRACADSHRGLDGGKGHARLLREGMRFGDFLVATSCRSCHKPYCMDGCPVDAIHRRGSNLQIVIENHCIGCSLCEQNCPYGSIHMVARSEPGAGMVANPPRQAVNCDLCGPVGGDPYCVSACPHEAAFRMDGKDLFDEVLERLTAKT